MKAILRFYRKLDKMSEDLKWWQWCLFNVLPPCLMLMATFGLAIGFAMLYDRCTGVPAY